MGCVNGQAELYPNGDVELRWGTLSCSLSPRNFASGLKDGNRDVPEAFPATGDGFSSDGTGIATFDSSTVGPAGQCRRFSTDFQTYVESSTECESFESIAGMNDAMRHPTLESCHPETVSFGTPLCSIPLLDLPFDFQWFGETAVRNLDVSNYGEIYIGADIANQNRSGRGQPVEIGGFNDRGRIAVASTDRSYESVDVWILMKETSVIISWSARDSGDVSFEAQAELYANGKVDLRWNDGRNFGLVRLTIAAGIEDDTRLIPEAFPATGFPFGDGGQALNFGFPRGQCRRFKLQYG